MSIIHVAHGGLAFGYPSPAALGADWMTDLNSVEYYLSRERRERELAAAAANPTIAAVHLEMATRYADLIDQAVDAPARRGLSQQ